MAFLLCSLTLLWNITLANTDHHFPGGADEQLLLATAALQDV